MNSKMNTFYILLFTQGLSALGSALTYFTLVIWLTTKVFDKPSQSGDLSIALTVLTIMTILPGIVISPLAGVWVDRLQRKKVMVFADLLQGLTAFTIFLFIYNELTITWTVFLIIGILSGINVFHSIAFNASYIMVVPEEKLPRANALMQTMWTLTGVLAPVIATLLISRINVSIVLAIDAMTFIVSMVGILFLAIPSPMNNIEHPKLSLKQELAIGSKFLIKKTGLLWLLLVGVIANIALSAELLLPIYVRNVLEVDHLLRGWSFEATYAFIETAGFIGGALTGLVLAWWGGAKNNLILGVILPQLICGLLFVFLGFSSILWASGLIYFLRNGLSMIANAHSSTIWQRSVPPELQGRVFGVNRFITNLMVPLSMGLMGILGTITTPSMIFIFSGCCLLVFTLLVLLSSSFRSLEVLQKDQRSSMLQEL